MTQYQRITGKVFGGNATATGNDPQIAQFGSALAGTFIGTTDPETIQQLPAWGEGWSGAVTPETQFPPMPEMTGAMKVLSHQICGILQQGVSTWDNGTVYYTGNFCSKNGIVYVSLSDENQGNDPEADTTNWRNYGGADKDLSNLSSQGQNIANWSTNVTNCIARKPQKFNLELADGVLTLKANSIVTVANSFEADETTPKFDEITVNTDVSSSTTSASTKVLISYSTSSNVLIALPLANSTAGAGVTATNGLAFNTTTNKISSYNSSGSLQYSDCCLPLAIVSTDSSGKYTTIDQIFDGIGYIGTAGTTGSTIWLNKDVVLIIPNGRNEDGTLKNIVFTTTRTLLRNGVKGETRRSVSFYSTNAIGIGTGFMSARTYADRDSTFGYQYVEDLNKTFVSTRDYAEPLCIIADITCNANAITSFRPRNTFRALDINDKAEIVSWSFPSSGEQITIATNNVTISSGVYSSLAGWQAPADGWVMIVTHTSAVARVWLMTHSEQQVSSENQILTNHFYSFANIGIRNYIEIAEGQYFTLYSNQPITQSSAVFTYAKGAI